MFLLRISEVVLELHWFCSLNAVVIHLGQSYFQMFLFSIEPKECVYRTSHSNGLWFWRLTKESDLASCLSSSVFRLWWEEPWCTHRPDSMLWKGALGQIPLWKDLTGQLLCDTVHSLVNWFEDCETLTAILKDSWTTSVSIVCCSYGATVILPVGHVQ
jgi:hypothetical protein